jgi:hypothetical protein
MSEGTPMTSTVGLPEFCVTIKQRGFWPALFVERLARSFSQKVIRENAMFAGQSRVDAIRTVMHLKNHLCGFCSGLN